MFGIVTSLSFLLFACGSDESVKENETNLGNTEQVENVNNELLKEEQIRQEQDLKFADADKVVYEQIDKVVQ